MFTVVICSNDFIDACTKRYNAFLSPVLLSDNFAFCRWNTSADSLDDAVPELKETVKGKRHWQALIVQDREISGRSIIDKANPFDFVGTVKMPEIVCIDYADSESEFDYSSVAGYREGRSANFRKALSNPITRLTGWLCGCPAVDDPQLTQTELKLLEMHGNDYREYVLDAYVNPETVDINPEAVEYRLSMSERYKVASDYFTKDPAITNFPDNVVLVSERSDVPEREIDLLKTHFNNEFDYSRFYEDNLYSEKLRYLVYDIEYVNNDRIELDYLNFLTNTLLMAAYGFPIDAMRSNRVYSVDTDIDFTKLSDLCNQYLSKLKATARHIEKKMHEVCEDDALAVVDNATAEKVFEEEVSIPVDPGSRYDRTNLMCEYKIGMSRDCPTDEANYWSNQYDGISKLFVRYLREPRRAVKRAVDGDFRSRSKIVDRRALNLNEYQAEDVKFKLDDEELNMVETQTTNIYNIKRFRKALEEENVSILRKIATRLTKKRTIILSAICLLMFVIGFIPMFVSNLNTGKSFSVSLLVFIVVVALFLLCGFICILVFKRRMVNRFKHFNYAMNGICDEIDAGMDSYSRYLSHACNVRREFSVLNYISDQVSENKTKYKILNKHLFDVKRATDDFIQLFEEYVNVAVPAGETEPYEFDYFKTDDYTFSFPVSEFGSKIDFLEKGFEITMPIDYITSANLKREELYD